MSIQQKKRSLDVEGGIGQRGELRDKSECAQSLRITAYYEAVSHIPESATSDLLPPAALLIQ